MVRAYIKRKRKIPFSLFLLLYLQCGDPVQILIDAVQELIESHEAAEGGGGGGNGDKREGQQKGGGGVGGAERGEDGGCVSQLSFADAAPRSHHLHSSGMVQRGEDGGCVSQLSFADAAPPRQHLHSSGMVQVPSTVPYCTG